MRLTSRVLLTVVTVLAMVAAACGDDGGEADATPTDPPGGGATDDSTPPPADSTPDPAPADVELIASARGITEDTIHVGMAIADVTAFSETGNQNARFQEIADLINANGGVIGRQLELHFADWDLLDSAGFDAACVELTQDVEVFAVIARVPANFGKMTCFTDLNDHITVNGLDLDESEIAASEGKLFSILSDRFAALLGGLDALAPELADAKVAITAGESGDGAAQAALVEEKLVELGIEVVETTLGTISYSADPTAALAEQNRFAERWTTAGATHLIGIGNAVVGATKALVDTGINDGIVLVTPNTGVRTLDSLGVDLSLLDMIGVTAPDFAAVAEEGINGMPECIEAIESAGLGPVILYPEEEELTALPSTAGACAMFDFLSAVLEEAGPNPTQDDFLAVTGREFTFEMTSAGSASTGPGKAYLNDDPGIIYDWDPAGLVFTPRG